MVGDSNVPQRSRDSLIRDIQVVERRPHVVTHVHCGSNNYITTVICEQAAFSIQLLPTGGHVNDMLQLRISKFIMSSYPSGNVFHQTHLEKFIKNLAPNYIRQIGTRIGHNLCFPRIYHFSSGHNAIKLVNLQRCLIEGKRNQVLSVGTEFLKEQITLKSVLCGSIQFQITRKNPAGFSTLITVRFG